MNNSSFRLCLLLTILLLGTSAFGQVDSTGVLEGQETPAWDVRPDLNTSPGSAAFRPKDITSISLDVLCGPDAPEELCSWTGEEGGLAEGARDFPEYAFHWQASGLSSNPLYFEDVSLERYGHVSHLQPVVSAAKFFATVPFLPCKVCQDHPCKRVYTLGFGRPGECVKPVRERLPLTPKRH